MSVGRKPFEPSAEQRMQVRIMSACGMPQDLICDQILNTSTGNRIDRKTLAKVFKHELQVAKSAANAMVAQTLFKKAVSGNIPAAIFWLKTQACWRETSPDNGDDDPPPPTKVEITVKDARKPAE